MNVDRNKDFAIITNKMRGSSSVGRASRSQREGRQFDSGLLHIGEYDTKENILNQRCG